MTHRSRSLTTVATSVVALTLALGVLLPGSRSSGRDRPMRRAARTGWCARSVSSGVWIVPDQEIHVAAPGSADGDRDAFPSGGDPDGARGVPSPAATVAPDLVVGAAPAPAPQPVPARLLLPPSAGRAPPVLLS
ncbi:MAG: hypothetical protein Q7J25_09025 [Vicinamibacterales bacterium]|nr:hypothetical protein [Vicinamibacterales bacterium]